MIAVTLLEWVHPSLAFNSTPKLQNQQRILNTPKTLAKDSKLPYFLSDGSSQSTNNDDDDSNDDDAVSVLDVLVCGAGPGGLLLAKELPARNLQVSVVDPALDKQTLAE